MIDDIPVVDAVVHPYHLGPSNQVAEGASQLEGVYASHLLYSGEPVGPHHLRRDEFFTDFPGSAVARAVFAESDVDLAVLHSLPNLGFTKGYITDPAKVAALRDRHPDRFLLYGTVDAPVVDTAIEQLAAQVSELAIDGLKVYPASYYDGTSMGWRMDSPDFAVPLLAAAHDLGIRNVAVHKALWVPPAPRDAFRVDDLSVAAAFPELNFQIVHAGMAFLAETCEVLARHPNTYATLESTFSYVLTRPAAFAEVLAALLRAGGAERLLFATGANLMHPAPLLAAFRDFQLPSEVQERFGVGPLTDSDRAQILGGNVLRLHGLDASAVTERPPDVFDELRAAGTVQPWSGIRDAGASA